MSGFYCGICGKNSDETEANFWEDKIVCTSCFSDIKIDEEISNEPIKWGDQEDYNKEMELGEFQRDV